MVNTDDEEGDWQRVSVNDRPMSGTRHTDIHVVIKGLHINGRLRVLLEFYIGFDGHPLLKSECYFVHVYSLQNLTCKNE